MKKMLKKLSSVVLAVVILFSCFIFMNDTIQVSAATEKPYQTVNITGNTKINGYTFERSLNSSGCFVLLVKKGSGSRKTVTSQTPYAVSNGNTTIYALNKIIYKYDYSKNKTTKIKKFSSEVNVVGAYGNRIAYVTNNKLYYYNTKTKKSQLMFKNFGEPDYAVCYGKYIFNVTYNGIDQNGPLYRYNLSTGKAAKIAKSAYAFSGCLCVTSKAVYYLKQIKENTMSVYKVSLSGGTSKRLKTVKNFNFLPKLTSNTFSYCSTSFKDVTVKF